MSTIILWICIIIFLIMMGMPFFWSFFIIFLMNWGLFRVYLPESVTFESLVILYICLAYILTKMASLWDAFFIGSILYFIYSPTVLQNNTFFGSAIRLSWGGLYFAACLWILQFFHKAS
jgi:hypothetical protein